MGIPFTPSWPFPQRLDLHNKYFVTKRPIGLVSYDALAIDTKIDALVETFSIFPRRLRLRGQGQPSE